MRTQGVSRKYSRVSTQFSKKNHESKKVLISIKCEQYSNVISCVTLFGNIFKCSQTLQNINITHIIL